MITTPQQISRELRMEYVTAQHINEIAFLKPPKTVSANLNQSLNKV